MRKIPIGQAQAGQVISRPVHGQSGALLCQPGTMLTDVLIERFENFGVDLLVVDSAGDSQELPSISAASMDERFAGHEQDDLMMALKQVVMAQFSGRGHQQ